MKDLERLCAELEAGWFSTGDPSLVDKLATEHPELADDLYDHFALMIESELGLGGDAEHTRVTEKAGEWLRKEGFQAVKDIAASHAGSTTTTTPDPPPQPPSDRPNVVPFPLLSRQRTGMSGDELSQKMGVPEKLLSLVMRAPPDQRGGIPREIARRAVAFGIVEEEAIESLNAPLRLAARKRTDEAPLTLREQLGRLGLSAEELEYWTKVLDTKEQ